ncbi:hypothetical protein ACHAWU_003420 [Discostella pseudostelligera]|uniref:SEA domain-containing protein n=1 Tax=Discostella pseudostelligera TaxID=259834 RepID=A0ABD3MU08_9STRA
MTPSASPVQKTNEVASQTNSTSSPTQAKTSSSVVLSPFGLSLQTHPGTDTVDTQELKVLVSKHLQTTMETAFRSADVMKLDINITRVPNQPNRRLQATGLIFADDNTTTNKFDFETSGIAYFSGSSVPNMEALDRVTLESFAGARGDEFVHSLRNAEDPGLRSTRTVDAETEISNNEEVETVDKLLNQTDDVSVGTDKRLSLLAIVFGVGLLLVAMHVMKTRRGRRIEREKRMNAMNDDIIGDEESPSELEFPTYIEVQKPSEQVNEPSWYDASCYSMPWSFCSQPGVRDDSNDTKPAQSVAAHEVLISTDDAPDSDIFSTVKSKGLSETMSVFPKDLQTLSGESDNERTNQQALHGWELCGGYGAEQEASNANDTNSSSSEDQNRVTGTVWGQKPSEGVAA